MKDHANIGKLFAKSCAQFMTACSHVPGIAAIAFPVGGMLAVQKISLVLQSASAFTHNLKHMKKSDFLTTLAFICLGVFGLLFAIVSAIAS